MFLLHLNVKTLNSLTYDLCDLLNIKHNDVDKKEYFNNFKKIKNKIDELVKKLENSEGLNISQYIAFLNNMSSNLKKSPYKKK